MAYSEKYYFTFKGLGNDNEYEVEILENDFTGATTEIRGMEKPFFVTYPKFEVFEPVRGSGCEINLFSETDRQFLGLYTPDMFKYQIQLKKNSGITWCGYLDSELYSEPFDSIDHYQVSLTGNDGLALLDRLYYVDGNGDNYTGITTQWDVLKNILTRLNLSWWGICVNVSTTASGITIGSEETLFHKVYVLNANFYDEDDEPFTCRKVLESILMPYGAFLTISDNKLIITDLNIILSGETSPYFKVYYPSDFTYSGVANITVELGDVSTIKFTSANQTLNILSGVNKQVVSYSPYRWIELIKFDDAINDFYGTVSIIVTRGDTLYQWEEYFYPNSYTWEKDNNGSFCSYLGIDGENSGSTDYYLKIVPYTGLGSSNDHFYEGFYGLETEYLGRDNYVYTEDYTPDDWSFAQVYVAADINDTWHFQGKATSFCKYDGVFYGCKQSHSIPANPAVSPAIWQALTQDAGNPLRKYSGYGVDTDVLSFTYTKQLPLLVPGENYRLKFEMQAYPRMSADLGNEITNDQIRKVELYTRLVVGDRKYKYYAGTPEINGTNSGWVDLADDGELRFRFENKVGGDLGVTPEGQGYEAIEDRWTDLKLNKVIPMTDDLDDDVVQQLDFTIPLTETTILNGGYMTFTIYHWRAYDFLLNDITDDVADLRLKNIKMTVVDANGNDITTSDTEYTGILNPLYKNEGSKIVTYLGTNYSDYPTERGGLFYYKFVGGIMPSYYENITQWERAGFTGTTEELLLRSLVSNYENPQFEITCSINRIDNIVGYLTYSNYLPYNFLITSCKHNFGDEITEIVMQQITEDTLSVYLNY
jgi:hypothetical protein